MFLITEILRYTQDDISVNHFILPVVTHPFAPLKCGTNGCFGIFNYPSVAENPTCFTASISTS
ncbi:MAG: hypothetical protein ACE5H1_08220, partial [Thermodesulfobacteriota bacterium]